MLLIRGQPGEAGLLWSPKETLGKCLVALWVENPGILRKSCIPPFPQVKLGSGQGLWPWTLTSSAFVSSAGAVTMTWTTRGTGKMSPTGGWVLPTWSSGQTDGAGWPDSLFVLSHRVYEYRRIPPLLNRVPVKIRRTHVGVGVKSSFSPHKAPRNSQLPPGQIKRE